MFFNPPTTLMTIPSSKPPFPSHSHSRYPAPATQEVPRSPPTYFQIMPKRCKKAYNDPFGTNPPYLAIHAAAQLPKTHRTSAKLPKNYSKSQNRLLTLNRSQLPKPQEPQHIRRQHNQDPQRHHRTEYRRRKRVVGRKPRDPLRGFACSLVGSAQRGTEVFPGAEHGFQSS